MAAARLLAAALALLGLAAAPAGAQTPPGMDDGSPPTGPLNVAATYGGDLLWNVAGGARPGAMYWARLGLIFDSDLDSAVGWRGATAHMSLHALHGVGLAGDRVESLMTVSSLAAEPNLRLFNLWIEQRLGPRASLRLGQFTAAQEFMVSSTASLFVNSTFGWPASFAADLPSGGPSYPIAAPGARLTVKPAATTTLLAAVFPGDPAGHGSGDPQRRDAYGLNSFRLSGRPFVMAEAAWQAPVVTVKLGGWVHFDRFADVRPRPPGAPPAEHDGNSAVYAILDAPLWTAPAEPHRVLHGFLRGSLSPADRNRIDRYLDAGLALSAPFASRSDDTAGLAVGYARLQPDGGAETVIEASYQAQLTKAVAVQPDLQLVLHPNGGVAADGTPLRDAVVLGVRAQLHF
jgi:porin